jgi:hypothetical protein
MATIKSWSTANAVVDRIKSSPLSIEMWTQSNSSPWTAEQRSVYPYAKPNLMVCVGVNQIAALKEKVVDE